MIAILDYDAGNIRSVEKAVEALGEKTVVTRDRHSILSADKVILPGVGAFGDAMARILLIPYMKLSIRILRFLESASDYSLCLKAAMRLPELKVLEYFRVRF